MLRAFLKFPSKFRTFGSFSAIMDSNSRFCGSARAFAKNVLHKIDPQFIFGHFGSPKFSFENASVWGYNEISQRIFAIGA